MAARLPFSNGAYSDYNSQCQNYPDRKASYFACPTVDEDVDPSSQSKRKNRSLFRKDPVCFLFVGFFALVLLILLVSHLSEEDGEQYYTLTEVKWANITENYTLSESEIQSVFDFLTTHQIEPTGTLFLSNGSLSNETTDGAVGIPYEIRHFTSQEQLDAAIKAFRRKAAVNLERSNNETYNGTNNGTNPLVYDHQSDIWHYRRPSFFTLLWLGAWRGNWHGGRSHYGYQFGPRYGSYHPYSSPLGAAAAGPTVRGMFSRSTVPGKATGMGSFLSKLGLGGQRGIGAGMGEGKVASSGKSGGWLGGWSGGRSSSSGGRSSGGRAGGGMRGGRGGGGRGRG